MRSMFGLFRSLCWVAVVVPALAACRSAAAQSSPPGSFDRVWGALWYLRSIELKDDVTLVYGGVEGSSAVVYRDSESGKSHWVLIESPANKKLFVRLAETFPYEKWTTVRGQFITTTKTLQFSEPKEADRRDLSFALADMYAYEKEASTGYIIRHAPFFIGKGWPNNAATKADVESLCASLDLMPTFVGTRGYVTLQSPKEGERIDGTTPPTMTITLDDSIIPLPAFAPGDKWSNAIQVVDNGGDGVEEVAQDLTSQHIHDEAASTVLPGTHSDIFFRVPSGSVGKVITVTQPKKFDRIALSAWQLQGGVLVPLGWQGNPHAAVLGHCVELKFSPNSDDCFVMAEIATRNIGSFRLKFQWL